jgi:hypothetical protein
LDEGAFGKFDEELRLAQDIEDHAQMRQMQRPRGAKNQNVVQKK